MGNRRQRTIQEVHRTLRDEYGVEVVRGRRGSGTLVYASTGKRVGKRRFLEIAADMRARGLQLHQTGEARDG